MHGNNEYRTFVCANFLAQNKQNGRPEEKTVHKTDGNTKGMIKDIIEIRRLD